MTRSRMATMTVVILGLVLGVSGTAAAHYVYQQGYVWQNGQGQCLNERMELSHGSGGGYTRTDLRATTILNTTAGSYHCSQTMLLPASYMRVTHQLDKWNGSSWGYCTSTGLIYRSTTDDPWVRSRNWNVPCGRGYYVGWGRGQINFDGSWRGGWLSSKDSHYLPA